MINELQQYYLLSSWEHSLNVLTAHWLLNVLLTFPFVAQTGRKCAGQAVCPHVEGGLSQTTTDNTRSATMINQEHTIPKVRHQNFQKQ